MLLTLRVRAQHECVRRAAIAPYVHLTVGQLHTTFVGWGAMTTAATRFAETGARLPAGVASIPG